ncbi:Atrial natriuretic peptide receptor 1 [Liparis tanakae]|uniref:Atrial natriuretic peptide receptor 1 n=1 Tax=Liparis tanakae TaxID=230148 RepID=A0A4Z2F9Q5_9TELE|nr:Atrial natriuretic peptide receptor 1 [Liparis tanakae]
MLMNTAPPGRSSRAPRLLVAPRGLRASWSLLEGSGPPGRSSRAPGLLVAPRGLRASWSLLEGSAPPGRSSAPGLLAAPRRRASWPLPEGSAPPGRSSAPRLLPLPEGSGLGFGGTARWFHLPLPAARSLKPETMEECHRASGDFRPGSQEREVLHNTHNASGLVALEYLEVLDPAFWPSPSWCFVTMMFVCCSPDVFRKLLVEFRKADLAHEQYVFFYIDVFGDSLNARSGRPWARGDQDDAAARDAFQSRPDPRTRFPLRPPDQVSSQPVHSDRRLASADKNLLPVGAEP